MISDATLRSIRHYLSGQKGVTAIVDSGMNIMWESSEGFFEDIDLSGVKKLLPIHREQVISVTKDGKKLALDISPIFRSKKLVGAYTLKALDEDDVMDSVVSTGFNDLLRQNYEMMQYELSNAINLNELALRNGKSSKKKEAFLTRQSFGIQRMLLCNTNLLALASDNGNCNCTSCIDIYRILSDIVAETEPELNGRGWSIVFSGADEGFYSEIYERSFVLSVMNLIHACLIYAPQKSRIDISLSYSAGGIKITIESPLDEKPLDVRRAEQAKACFFVAKRLLDADCGGTADYEERDGGVCFCIMLKKAGENAEPVFLSEAYKDYITGKFKPVHLFVSEIIANKNEM